MADETKKSEELEDLDPKQDPKGGKKPEADMKWFPQRSGPVTPQGPTD